ncbi:beta-lactamase family protein [Gemmata sp. G18]|uniref:Beta-lactamase family protein n=1 Tax=Gemmata palustris TaxID=2822762 RepID=A0ABS5BJV3_9BACT|nr:serine hydrolase domain-containing protein [Gemmata palustris]MBP3953757.1 beta-lactamase family protein [Gemmata palustris]
MTSTRARFCQRTAVWVAAVWFVPMSVSVAAEEKAAFPAATPESQGVSAAAVRRVASEVEEYVKNGTIVGGELLIIKNRKTILHEVYGDRDREDKRAMERGTVFNVRSMTKPLTGVAVQMLADEGKLSLDDPVAKHLPGFDNDKSKAITIGQLLQHRSGLPLTILKVKIDEHPDLQAQAKAIGENGPRFKPGEKFWYSDAGSDAAAAVVERISGTTIDRFVAERILQPLGMADSFYLSKADDPRKKRVASLYLGKPGEWTRFWKPDGAPFYPFAWGSQTLYSTPADYARFLALWMDGGMGGGKRLLSNEAIARILAPVSPMKALGTDKPYPCGFFGLKPHYGQMSMLYAPGDSPARTEVRAFGHGGSDGTGAWAFPAENLIVCYFTQSRGQVSTIRLETTIQDALLPREGTGKVPDEMKPLVGTYYATFGPFKNTPFQVVFRCGKLALDIPGELVYELREPDKEGRRQLASSDSTGVSFKKDGEGKVSALLLHKTKTTYELPRDKPDDAKEPKK